MTSLEIRMADCERLDVTEYELHKFSAEASTLGLKPGEWPTWIKTDLGNGMAFLLDSQKFDGENDLMWVDYRQGNGCITLRIYND